MELSDIADWQAFVASLVEQPRIAEAEKNNSMFDFVEAAKANGKSNIRRDWTTSSDSKSPPDLLLSSNDSIIFHVHRSVVLAKSANMLGMASSSRSSRESIAKETPPNGTSNSQVRQLPYTSRVVNVLLHIVYNDGCDRVATTSMAEISSVIRALKEYGIPLKPSTSSNSMLFRMLSEHCQKSDPLQVYIFAASHAPDLQHIAVYASRFLLSLDFCRITDEMATSIGAIYLLRLYTLLTGRTREFKRLLIPPPQPHEPLPQCDAKILREAWTLVTTFLVWAAAPDVKDATIDKLKAPAVNKLQCKQCKAHLERRFNSLKQSWSSVQVLKLLVPRADH
ncbi:hypothetical protein SCHPADRAFT_886817 [Schizopora paradoxa]|uniref:BTB domain-containing protein n=1 Tax=Schizopora paradoxa TaxID=27342 RepID=A0A0H2S1C4_9AGAM|nr:hypothetical protein SCHPADRAFT_886817 [Schizopora paradoxa]